MGSVNCCTIDAPVPPLPGCATVPIFTLGALGTVPAGAAGGAAGACAGIEGYPTDAVEILGAANPDLALDQLADDLLALRVTSTLRNETART